MMYFWRGLSTSISGGLGRLILKIYFQWYFEFWINLKIKFLLNFCSVIICDFTYRLIKYMFSVTRVFAIVRAAAANNLPFEIINLNPSAHGMGWVRGRRLPTVSPLTRFFFYMASVGGDAAACRLNAVWEVSRKKKFARSKNKATTTARATRRTVGNCRAGGRERRI